jgi:SPP1 gp7 family putative phage head morphogenesis protein
MRRVADSLGTPGQLAGKAEMIARTETLTAVSIGLAAAMKNAAEVIPGLKKGWMTAGDDRVRDSHAAINGEVIESDEKFSNGLAHPRDTNSTDASEVIACRCSLILIPPGETLEIP